MNNSIKLNDILQLTEEEIKKFKLHLAFRVNGTEPLDVFIRDKEEWKGWNEFKDEGGKNVWNREYIFTLIPDYHKFNKYIFGGIYRVDERKDDKYSVSLTDQFKSLIGRLVVDFNNQRSRGRAFIFENFIDHFSIAEILPKSYEGENFPGYDNVNIDFHSLEFIVENAKQDWKTALQNTKGVYLIIDKKNGKKYVGSAYGNNGIWSRWSCYIGSGHGGNDRLAELISQNGMDYVRENFKFSILEVYTMKTGDESIIRRESFWKDILLTRGNFGYNNN